MIEVQTLPLPQVDRAAVARALAAAVADAIPCRVDAVWTTWRTLDAAFMGLVEAAPGGAVGPIVHVYHHRSPEQVERAVEAIEMVLARELSVDRDRIFVTTQPTAIDDPIVGG